MSALDEQLAERLSTIHHDDPEAIRRELNETLLEYVHTDLALFLQCVKDSEGDYRFTAPVVLGDDLVEEIVPFCEGPALDCPWIPENIDPDEIDRFICVHRFYSEEFLQNLNVIQKVMNPLDITGQLRCVFYDGPELMGYLCMMRRGEEASFRDGERELVRNATSEIKSLISMANSLESEMTDDELFAVVKPDGAVEFASDAFGEWTNETKSSYVRRRVVDADRGVDRLGIEIRGGKEIRMTRLDGTGGVRYLVSVDRPELAKIRPEYWLTDRQSEIAEYAAAGATNREIGDALDISPQTVKVHIRNIYDRLGIGSRVELASMIGEP